MGFGRDAGFLLFILPSVERGMRLDRREAVFVLTPVNFIKMVLEAWDVGLCAADVIPRHVANYDICLAGATTVPMRPPCRMCEKSFIDSKLIKPRSGRGYIIGGEKPEILARWSGQSCLSPIGSRNPVMGELSPFVIYGGGNCD